MGLVEVLRGDAEPSKDVAKCTLDIPLVLDDLFPFILVCKTDGELANHVMLLDGNREHLKCVKAHGALLAGLGLVNCNPSHGHLQCYHNFLWPWTRYLLHHRSHQNKNVKALHLLSDRQIYNMSDT